MTKTLLDKKDIENLHNDLKNELSGEVRFDRMSRYLYSTDASSYQIQPTGVVIPADEHDIISAVKLASGYNTPIIPRGGGTSLSGQGIGTGIILDVTPQLDKILEINLEEKWAHVEAGVVLDQLNTAVQAHGLMVGPDPSSAAAATLGGMAANNSTGSHSIVYKMMLDHVLEVNVVLSDGNLAKFKPYTNSEITRLQKEDSLEGKLYIEIPKLLSKYEKDIQKGYPKTWRNVAGYNLNRMLSEKDSGNPFNLTPLIVGSEGTLATIVSLKVNLVPRPKHTYLVLLHFDSLYESLEIVPKILESSPSAIELLDEFFINLTRQNKEYARRLDFIEGDPKGVQVVEFAGNDIKVIQEKSNKLVSQLKKDGYKGAVVEISRPDKIANVWQVRKAGLGLLLSKRGDAKPLAFIDDAAVPVKHLADYVRKVEQICREAGTEAGFYAHASAGCLHINPMINLKTSRGIQQLRSISEAVIESAIGYGGTSTGEHGEGLARSYYNKKVYGSELHQAFRKLKGLFDPQNIFNPGKIVDTPLPSDPDLTRFNPSYQTPQTITDTIFSFEADRGFNGLVEMCNGQGSCRKLNNGVMCPSFMATHDEAYSTRGRANALRAAITGQLGSEGLDDPALYDILDLCLGCKACKSECPSLVDMAKLKYEYLSTFQERNGIPLPSRMFAHIAMLNKLGNTFGGISNKFITSKLFKLILQKWLGIDKRRSLPQFAKTTFQKWFYQHTPLRNAPKGKIILWDDTFLSYNEPDIGIAAVSVLEHAGYEVLLPEGRKCCGRPMISKGLLKDARKNALHNVQLLLPYVTQGIRIVCVEPGCISVFRDEYNDLVGNENAKIISENSYFIEEYIMECVKEDQLKLAWKKSSEENHILLHGHCYQKALIGTSPVLNMLRLIPNSDVEEIDSGCCGMAGSFGYEQKHYEISLKCGEDRLFPAIRNASSTAKIAASGTSCRHQILDGTGRNALHPIVVFSEALDKAN
jgi:FAD/FMN-containing dehydrogenase/Fe-S oxidoreductase